MTQTAMEVLLVEDNPADVRLTEEALREGTVPLHLSVTPDGVEALAFLRREGRYAAAPRPDLVLLDLNLPRLDGRAVLAAVKADPSLRRIPVVVLSTSEAEADIATSYDLHANCYVSKSPDLDQFFRVMGMIEEFWLAVARRPLAPSRIDTTPAGGDAGRRTVLVIDDDPGIVDLVRAALEDAGYGVLAAVGQEALRVAHERRPDLVLLDLNMPGLDGATLSRRLRDDPATAAIPIVVMSGQVGLRAAAALLPGNDWLAKPFELAALYATVARWARAGA